ncbi:MAG: hypothetical protein DMG69_25270 [Acidobacteria bacterium]|nr:MAG: hypothetical protein DMG69_25270 [Acidobacteriota bacterium]
MTLFTEILGCILGVLFMFAGFYAAGIRGAFGRGPSHPISKAGRVIIFLAGMAVFIDGLQRLLGRSGGLDVGWRVAVPSSAVLILFFNSKFVRAYMRRVVRSSPTVAINFANGLPSAMVGARIAFLVIVAVMVMLGVCPVAGSTARVGIGACAFALFGVGLLHSILENYYINTGRATVTKLPTESTGHSEEQ